MDSKKNADQDAEVIPPERRASGQKAHGPRTIEADQTSKRPWQTARLFVSLLILIVAALAIFYLTKIDLEELSSALTSSLDGASEITSLPHDDEYSQSGVAEEPFKVVDDGQPDELQPNDVRAAQNQRPADPTATQEGEGVIASDGARSPASVETAPQVDVIEEGLRAVLFLRAGMALDPVWPTLVRSLPSDLLVTLEPARYAEVEGRDQLIISANMWWSAYASTRSLRLDTSMPALVDDLLNRFISVQQQNDGFSAAQSFHLHVARGDIAAALRLFDQMNAEDRQALTDWRARATLYLARASALAIMANGG